MRHTYLSLQGCTGARVVFVVLLLMLASCVSPAPPRNPTVSPPVSLVPTSVPTTISGPGAGTTPTESKIALVIDHEFLADEAFASSWLPGGDGFAVAVRDTDFVGVRLYDALLLEPDWSAETGLALDIAPSPDGMLLARPDPTEGYVDLLSSLSGDASSDALYGEKCIGGEHIAFFPDGDTVMTGHTALDLRTPSRVYTWSVTSRNCAGALLETEGSLDALEMNPDGASFATGLTYGGGEGAVFLWDLPTGSLRCKIPGHHPQYIDAGATVVVAELRNTSLGFYDSATCKPRWTIEGPGHPFAVGNDTGLVASYEAAEISVWDPQSGEKLSSIVWPSDEDVEVIEFSPDDTRLLAISPGRGPERAVVALFRVVSLNP